MIPKQILAIFLIHFSVVGFGQKTMSLFSPSKNIKIAIKLSDSLYYSVNVDDSQIITDATLALMTSFVQAGIRPALLKSSLRSVKETIINPVPFKRKNIPNHFNELTLYFRDKFSVTFRAYDDGIAYRFTTAFKDSIEIKNEIATFRFPGSDTVYFPMVQKRDNLDIFHTSFEEPYQKVPLDKIESFQLAFTPVLIAGKVKTLITESDLWDYPGMFLKGNKTNELVGIFSGYPEEEEVQGGDFKQPVVIKRKPFIAKTAGHRSFPWRVIVLARGDADLLMNDLVYRLGSPAQAGMDWSWIKPGLSTEEWICGSNIYHVDFESGINTATYKYYIDFASRFGMEYVMLDAGWSDNNDLFKITPGLDLEEVARYAKSKNVSLILWTLSMTLDRQLEDALTMFNRLGVKVIMTDFMDRDDQRMMNFYNRIADATARHQIMVMFHGAFKNAGFERTYPHAITREAILGSEYNIWSDKASPEHDLLIPFIRMVSGPMDYEPGSLVNANKRTFKGSPDLVMSQGTRVHQLAMFVAYESPLQMFSGNPSDALVEPDYMTFLSSLPTTWDETRVVDAKLGDYLVIARKKGHDWYLAAMTDWTARELEAELSFLGTGSFRALSCEDGINAVQYPGDYQMADQLVDSSKTIKIKMAPGGGYVVKLISVNDGRP